MKPINSCFSRNIVALIVCNLLFLHASFADVKQPVSPPATYVRTEVLGWNKQESKTDDPYVSHLSAIPREDEFFCGYIYDEDTTSNHNYEFGIEIRNPFQTGAVIHFRVPSDNGREGFGSVHFTFRYVKKVALTSIGPISCRDDKWNLSPFNFKPSTNFIHNQPSDPRQCVDNNGVGFICPNQPGGGFQVTVPVSP